MDNEKTVYIICPQCGYVCRNDSPSRFPICECCKYEDPIIMSQADYKMFEDELTGKDPDAKCYESLREKYVYNNEHFSKKLIMICLHMQMKNSKRNMPNGFAQIIQGR